MFAVTVLRTPVINPLRGKLQKWKLLSQRKWMLSWSSIRRAKETMGPLVNIVPRALVNVQVARSRNPLLTTQDTIPSLIIQMGKQHQRVVRTHPGCSMLSQVRLFVTPWTLARQAPLSLGFSRQEHWSGLSFHSPGDFPNPGAELMSPVLAGSFF